MRVVFFGSPEFAVPTLEAIAGSAHTIVGVVTQPDRPRGRGQKVTAGPVKTAALTRGIPVLQPEHLRRGGDADAIAGWGAEIGVVAAYGRILPEWLLQTPPRGMINVHASLLPKYRGAAPVQRAILAGEPDTGVTIMRVVKALDAGPMLARRVVAIGAETTSEALEAELGRVGAAALVETLDALGRGPVIETPQDDAHATYAAKITRLDGLVDWRRPAQAIHDQIRGLHPWPRASAVIDGARIILHESRVVEGIPGASPGVIVAAGPAGVDVVGGDGRAVRVLALQSEGGRRVTAAEFLAARTLAAGQTFELP